MTNSSPWGVSKLDSEFILKTQKWPWGPGIHTEAALHQLDSASASYQTDSAGLDLSVRSAYKKSFMKCFCPFGLSWVGHGVNGHQQRPINSDVIYGWVLLDQQSRSSAKMYLLIILCLVFCYQASVCSGADRTPTPASIHPSWMCKSLAASQSPPCRLLHDI